MTAGPKATALAIALTLSAAAARAGDYRAEIMDHVIEPCFLRLAQQRPAVGRSPEAAARAMMLQHGKGLSTLVDSIDRQLSSNPPPVARRQIYRIALRACLRQGAARFGPK
ncbi:MAG: hypothetical protein OXC28_21920 [Defluviicoccus sp.]|nr:hypothetical protein [Defluviicoccus sp.]